jgi:hypothetical protein
MGDYVYQQCSGVSAAAGLKSSQFNRKRYSKKANNEYSAAGGSKEGYKKKRMSNIECRRKEFYRFYKKD